jgi:gliding motility-associated-like protein
MSYDINGNIYVVGWSEVYDFPVVDPGGGAYVVTNPQYGYAQVLFISQFNASNQLIWSTRIEGNDYDPTARVCTDKLGNIYIAGDARSTNYPLLNAGGYFSNNNTSVITRFNPARQITWSTRFPSPFTMSGLTTDNNNNLYVVADRRIAKFDTNTQEVFERSVITNQMHFWKNIIYDSTHDQLQLLGIMNDIYFGFLTINTPCNGSFFHNGLPPRLFNSATGPIFATMTRDGSFSYLSLADWVAEYYQLLTMTVDSNGDPIYLFGDNQNGSSFPNPQLTTPGNGAYFDTYCAQYGSALLLKLTASESINVTVQIIPGTNCNCNASATASVQCGTSPYTYLWSNGSTNVTTTGLCPGYNWLKVTDANNISKTVTLNIPYPPGSVTSIIPVVNPENCNKANGSISVQSILGGTGPFTYSLDGISYQPGTQFIGLTAGNHILRVKDAGGCVYNDTITLGNIPGPSNVLYTIKKRSCVSDDGQIVISNVQGGVGPYNYTLNGTVTTTNTTGIFNNLPAETYQLQLADTAGCTIMKPIILAKAAPPTDAFYNTGNDHCNMTIGLIQPGNVVGGQSPFTFSVDSFSFVSGVINNLSAGNYSYFVRDVNGCVLKKSPIVITNVEAPSSVNFNVNNAYCGKLTGSIAINSVTGNSPSYVYAVDDSVYQASGLFSSLQPGDHKLFVKDNFGCIYSQAFKINFKTTPKISLMPRDTTVCYGTQSLLSLVGDINQIKSVTWNISNQRNVALINASKQTDVIVNIVDSNSCTSTTTSIIRVKACNRPEKCIEIPTAFTPNKDGYNDLLRPLINGCKVESINFQIFNRYGQLIYETQKEGDGWDGYYQGEAQPAGGYAYICTYFIEGVHLLKKGTFMLIR